MSLTTKKYSKEKPWKENTEIRNMPLDESWNKLFTELFNDKRFIVIENKIKKTIQDGKGELIFPKPKYIFKAFCTTPIENVKVVFMGQDPYFNHDIYKNRICPQAYGLSFSVPFGIMTPSSLTNIFKNQYKFGHINKMPNNGCLDYWAYQGCLMLNSALTVIDGEKNCHQKEWRWFTDSVIRHISDTREKVVFVLWGGDAYKKIGLIDLDKHEVIISSHPSGLSVAQQFKSYSSFQDQDHFGQINSFLENKIDWILPEIT